MLNHLSVIKTERAPRGRPLLFTPRLVDVRLQSHHPAVLYEEPQGRKSHNARTAPASTQSLSL